MLTPRDPAQSGVSVLSKLKIITSSVALATLTACSSTPSRNNTPVERNISINTNGSIRYSPPNYPTYRGVESTTPSPGARAVIGWIGGFVLCRVLGANWVFSTACAVAGGTIWYNTAKTNTEIIQIDDRQMNLQLEEVYQNIILRKPDSLRGYNQSSNLQVTRYASILSHTQISRGTEVQFQVMFVGSTGRSQTMTGWAIRDKNGRWSPIPL